MLPISKQGLEKLQLEWDDLFKLQRPKLLIEIAAAAAQGDRSENAEYIYGRKKLREIDKRLRELDSKILNSTVVDAKPKDLNTVFFGAQISLQKADGKEWAIQLVGAEEIDPLAGKISLDSPLGKALLGQKANAKITVLTPKGPQRYTIVSIRYT